MRVCSRIGDECQVIAFCTKASGMYESEKNPNGKCYRQQELVELAQEVGYLTKTGREKNDR